jgi:hypothetical protein
MTYTVTSFGKAFPHVRNSLLKKAHVINKNIDGFYAKTKQEVSTESERYLQTSDFGLHTSNSDFRKDRYFQEGRLIFKPFYVIMTYMYMSCFCYFNVLETFILFG